MTMRKSDLIIVFAPADPALPVQVLEAALPDHLARARGVVCEVVPQLVSIAGTAHIVRVEDSIAFVPQLVPVREAKPASLDLAAEPGPETEPRAAFV